MNLGKVKSFLILLFLGINIYLIATMFLSTRFFEDPKALENCVTLLEEHGITLKKEVVPRYTVNLKGVDTRNAIYAISALQSDEVTREGNRFSFDANLPAAKGGDLKKAEKALKKHLKSMGFKTSHMDFSYSKSKNALYITCRADDFTVFDSRIKVTQKDDAFHFEGSWFEPMSDDVHSNNQSRNTVYITSVLMNLTQNEDVMKNVPFEITDVDYGYLAQKPYGEGTHTTATALPYYRIKDNKGNTYYYDAQSGAYLKN